MELPRVTVAVDGSPNGEKALEMAIDLARRYRSELAIVTVAPLIPVYVASTEPWVPAGVPETEVKQYRALVDAAVAKAQSAGLTAVTGACLEGVIVDELVAFLEANPTDLVVLGSRGLSTAKRIFLGSVSEAVMHHVRCPVLVVRTAN